MLKAIYKQLLSRICELTQKNSGELDEKDIAGLRFLNRFKDAVFNDLKTTWYLSYDSKDVAVSMQIQDEYLEIINESLDLTNTINAIVLSKMLNIGMENLTPEAFDIIKDIYNQLIKEGKNYAQSNIVDDIGIASIEYLIRIKENIFSNLKKCWYLTYMNNEPSRLHRYNEFGTIVSNNQNMLEFMRSVVKSATNHLKTTNINISKKEKVL